MKKRILAMVMAVVMAISLLPVSAFAAVGTTEEDDPLQPSDLYYGFDGEATTQNEAEITLHKQAESLGDGKFKVTLSATAKDVVVPRHTKVIFVLDKSTSMTSCADANHKSSHNNFDSGCTITGGQYTATNSRWTYALTAINTMKSKLPTAGIDYVHVAFGNNDNTTGVVSDYSTPRGINYTYLTRGVTAALDHVMNKDGTGGYTSFKTPSSKHVMIIVADGASNDGYPTSILEQFEESGGEVYAVGFTFSDDKFKNLATDANHYKNASSADELAFAMDTITQNIIGLITDPMGEKVNLTGPVDVEGYKTPASVVGSTINWTNEDGLTENQAVILEYTVEIKPEAKEAGEIEYPLNDNARLNYVHDGEDKSVLFPVPQTSFYAATLDVDYKLGDSTLKNDHEWIMLPGDFATKNADIPAVGDPVEIDKKTYYVNTVNGTIPTGLTENLNDAKAYEVQVILSENPPAPTTADYTVEYYYETTNGYVKDSAPTNAPTGGNAEINSIVSVAAADTADADNNKFAKIVTIDSTKYAFDAVHSDNVLTDTIEANANNNVLKVYYALDANNTNVPDKYEMTVKYESADKNAGDVSNEEEILPIYDEDGKWATTGKVTARGSAATAKTDYFFAKWTKKSNNTDESDTVLEATTGAIELTGVSAKEVHTYKAYFTKKTPGLTVTKTVAEVGSAAVTDQTSIPVAKVGDTIKWTITVSNTGNVDLTGINVTDSLADVTWGSWTAPEGVTVQSNVISKLAVGESASVTVSYPVTKNDVYKPERTISNSATATSDSVTDTGNSPDVEVNQDLTITFNANGGAWSTDVNGYTMSEEGTTASKTYQPSDIVAKITPDPTWSGKVFNGWYIEIEGQKEFVIWQQNFPQAKLIDQYGGVVYADWVDEPVDSLTYTVRQHYIGADGKEVAAVNAIDQTADKNTAISSLISSLEVNQTYYSQNYVYVADETTVNNALYKDDMKLAQSGTVIDLYYYLDEWNDKDDVLKGGDNTPDYQQAVVTFRADPNGSVGKDNEKTTQVYTLKKGTDGKYSDEVTPATVTPIPEENYAFDLWTKGEGETRVDPFVKQNLNGGEVVTYVAHFAVDVKGDTKDPENKGDKIPDKYQKKVTFKVVNGKWNNETTADVIKYVTLTKDGQWAVDGTYTVTEGDVKAIPAAGEKPNSGYKAGSWDALYKAGDVISADVTYTYTYAKRGGGSTDIPDNPPALNNVDHYAYIIGYPDGNVKPAGNITRAEVATIFFRLLTDESRSLFWSTENAYSDVSADQWFNNAISTLSNAGIINGYEDGTFRPNAPITRAEFAKIAASFFTYAEKEYQGLYPDVPETKWYALFVEAASELGLITGYPDGTFRPDQLITRAEACTIVNRTIERKPHEDQLHQDMILWPDNPAPGEVGHEWYYEQVQEATNSHEYEMKNEYENWTEILENRDWAALEQEWSDANSAPGPDVMK